MWIYSGNYLSERGINTNIDEGQRNCRRYFLEKSRLQNPSANGSAAEW